MAKIKAPNEQYTGVSAGVSFVNGVGECDDPERLKWFVRSGYMVEEETAQEPAADTELDKLTVPELKDHAAKAGIDLGDATKKDDILAAIKGVQQTLNE